MAEVFFPTLEKVATLLISIALGYFLRHKNLLPGDASKVLGKLCANIFLPAYTVLNISKNMTLDTLGENGLLALSGLVWLLGGMLPAFLIGRFWSRTPMEKATLTYTFLFSNYGYFGYPVIEGVFGEAVLGRMMLFLLPFSIAINSLGYSLFVEKSGGFAATAKRLAKTPVLWSVLLGVILGLTGLPLPGVIRGVLSGAGACMSPVSMLLAGVVLGGYPLKKLFGGKKGYLVVAARMLLFPAAGLGLCLLFRLKGFFFLFPMVMHCMPLGLNIVVFPESRGMDASENARMVFQSTLFSLLLLPPALTLIFRLAGLA